MGLQQLPASDADLASSLQQQFNHALASGDDAAMHRLRWQLMSRVGMSRQKTEAQEDASVTSSISIVAEKKQQQDATMQAAATAMAALAPAASVEQDTAAALHSRVRSIVERLMREDSLLLDEELRRHPQLMLSAQPLRG